MTKIYLSLPLNRPRPGKPTPESIIDVGVDKIELSSGKFAGDFMERVFSLSRRCDLQFHNYFPPFPARLVINLSSPEKGIRTQSFDFLLRSIILSSELGINQYSFHAGFLADPAAHSLGRLWTLKNVPASRDLGLKIFMEQLHELGQKALALGVHLFVENNVTTVAMRKAGMGEIMLLSHPEEIESVSSQLPSGVSLVIDVAHLEISGNTFEYPEWSQILRLSTCDAYHLSSCDGVEDQGALLSGEELFWTHLKKNVRYVAIEAKVKTTNQALCQVQLVTRRLRLER